MTRKVVFIVLMFLSVVSCDESFSPKGDYQERYALFGIMRADTNLQVVTLYKSFEVPGLNPFENKVDPFIKGAYVRIWKNKDEVFVLRDSSIQRSDTSRYTTPAYFYYTKGLIPNILDTMEIEAVLPNGRRLKAVTFVPPTVSTDYSATDRVIPVKGRNSVYVGWRANEQNVIYAPQLTIIYKKVENGISKLHKKIVPLKYFLINGIQTPLYPQPTSESMLEIEISAIEKALAEISEGDPNKGSYRILTMITNLYLYDRNLSAFYSSSNKFGDEYSIRVDESDFTNVEGGFGVFGSYSVKKIVQFFNPDYIRSFGYVPEIIP